jgi:trk system potassium uptake protein TrkA
MRRILPQGSRSEWQDPSGKVQLAEVPLHREWFGKPISLIEQHTQARVAFITRLGEGLIPNEHTVLQEGDLVHVMVEDSNLTATENSLLLPPGGE